MICSQCGAKYEADDDSCAVRFHALLALDHSRREPWGSLHGLAFSAYTLQHPEGQPDDTLQRCWLMLHRVIVRGDDPMKVATALRRGGPGAATEWGAPTLPRTPPAGGPYAVTIADLGAFVADTYRGRALEWADATVRRWAADGGTMRAG